MQKYEKTMYINIYEIINIKLHDSVKMDGKYKILMHITAIEFKCGDNKILPYYSMGELYIRHFFYHASQ